jgi:hypothetical protein
MNKKIVAAILIITLGLAVAGSAMNYNEIKTIIKTIKGAVHYIDAEGGFWGILGDNGKKYDPTSGVKFIK